MSASGSRDHEHGCHCCSVWNVLLYQDLLSPSLPTRFLTPILRFFAFFYSNMESSWNKRGYGSAISRSVEVWVFGAKILFKEIKLRKVGGVPSILGYL